ncbi:MAG: hypothetical protein ACRENH_06610, partial [Gemmatimonadaceae bacterium]
VAHVYHRDSAGSWLPDTILHASDAVSYMEFGSSVSIDGDLLIVGAHGGQDVMDAAYVFRRTGTTWVEEAKLTPLDTPVHRYFGRSVNVSRGIAVVGAPYDGMRGLHAGAAYVFERDSLGTWLQVRKLAPQSLTEGDGFGSSVSADFPRAIVGAYAGNGVEDLTGTSFLYQRGRRGWKFLFELLANNGGYGDAFGASVSMSGMCAIVGAPDRDVGGILKGAAYIYCIPVPGLEEFEIDIICCWQPPIPEPVVATIRYRNNGRQSASGRARVQLVSPSGKASETASPDGLVIGPGESFEERVVVLMPQPVEPGRYELRVRWSDDTGERIERAYFAAPGRNQAALGAGRQR